MVWHSYSDTFRDADIFEIIRNQNIYLLKSYT